ncbi:MAG: glutamine--tRNA ligase, partial [Acholeplasmataceae bacterium]|nr:glutamine--tRNA ligase [Acholeplasmataceae bacterium]
KVTITNYPEDHLEYFDVAYNQDNPELGERKIPFSRHIYIEADDFVVTKPNNKYKRLALDVEVRLFHAYFIKANEVIYGENGEVKEILATYDPETKSGSGFNERKPNGTIHYVEASQGLKTKINFFGPMIEGNDDMDLMDRFNPNSWTVKESIVETALIDAKPQDKFQFMRNGYFNVDDDSKTGHLIFNEIVPLKSSYK